MSKAPDSTHPDFWSTRYVSGQMPWDLHGVPQALTSYLQRTRRQKRGRVLIPGCGSGYEIGAFDAAGFEVTAIDFSPAAARRARRVIGRRLAARMVVADFFAYDFEWDFDLIYERTFLCALPQARWRDYARKLSVLCRPGGRLVGTYFIGRAVTGPPCPISEIKLGKLLGGSFERTTSRRVGDSLPVFGDRERWMEWRRK